MSSHVTYSELMELLQREYKVEHMARIQYRDSDNDLITVRSQSDLDVMLHHIGMATTFKIFIVGGSHIELSTSPPTAGHFAAHPTTASTSSSTSTTTTTTATPPSMPAAALVPNHTSKPYTVPNPAVCHQLSFGSLHASGPLIRVYLSSPQGHWKKGTLLGQGAFGKVYLGMHTETGQLIAVKQVSLEGVDSTSKQVRVENRLASER